MIRAGMDVARLHCSYAGWDEHAENIKRLREASRESGKPIKILQDLSGAKVRIKNFAHQSVELKAGAQFTLTSREVEGNESIVSITIPELVSVALAGDEVLLADGALKLKVLSSTSCDIHCKVIVGGQLKSSQAVHIPGKAPAVQVPTAKDLEDVLFGIGHHVDWIAQSYATDAREINTLRDFIRRKNAGIRVIAKIERRQALENLEPIIRVSDLVMVARGDLGLDIPIEQIALAQKHIIQCANHAGKPVITATEMLASMIDNNRPTRAEVADITNAILDGTDAIMLSGETAIGKFPIESLSMMNRIARATENHLAGKVFSGKTISRSYVSRGGNDLAGGD